MALIDAPKFALGLTDADVEDFRIILREECGEELSIAEAWTRATDVLTLFHYFLKRELAKSKIDEFERPPA